MNELSNIIDTFFIGTNSRSNLDFIHSRKNVLLIFDSHKRFDINQYLFSSVSRACFAIAYSIACMRLGFDDNIKNA